MKRLKGTVKEFCFFALKDSPFILASMALCIRRWTIAVVRTLSPNISVHLSKLRLVVMIVDFQILIQEYVVFFAI